MEHSRKSLTLDTSSFTRREDVNVKASNLLAFGPEAPITEAGLRTNIEVALRYVGSWMGGNGCVPIYIGLVSEEPEVIHVPSPREVSVRDRQ